MAMARCNPVAGIRAARGLARRRSAGLGIQTRENRKFGFRFGARLAGHGLHFVAVLGFTTD